MEEFEKCIKNLKDLNYPGIDMFGPEQLQNIFSQENRLFLLNWLIKNLFGQFDGSLETSSDIKDAEEIGEFLYEIGCCTSEQSNKFVKGDFTLSISEQIQIFDKMFYYLYNIPQKENQLPLPENSLTEIEDFLNQDVNIFPKNGPKQSFTPVERQQIIKDIQGKIERLKGEIGNEDYDILTTIEDEKFNYTEEQIEQYVMNFKEQLTNFQDVSEKISKLQCDRNPEKAEFSPDFKDVLANCSAKMDTVFEYFKSIDLSHQMNTKIHHVNLTECIRKLKELEQISSDITEQKKDADLI